MNWSNMLTSVNTKKSHGNYYRGFFVTLILRQIVNLQLDLYPGKCF